eukprot:TCONS_00055858-protein
MSDWDRNVTKRRPVKNQSDQGEFSFELFERQRERLTTEITERLENIDLLLKNRSSTDLVRNALEGLNRAFVELLFVCEKLKPLVYEVSEFDNWLGNIDTDIFLIKNSAIRYLKDNEPRESQAPSGASYRDSKA